MTRPMSSAATTSRTWTSPVSRSTSTLRHAGRPAEGRVGVAAVRLVVEADARIRLEALVDADRAARPGVVAVGGGERAAAGRLDLVAQPLGRLDQQATDDHRRPRRDGRPRIRDEGRVLRREIDRLEGHAEGVGHELREDRLGALAHLGRGGQDADRALGGQLERGDRCELDLAGAGEPGAVPGEREPDAAGHPLAPGPQRRARHRAGTRSAHAVRRRCERAGARTRWPRRRAPGPPRRRRCRAGPGRSGSVSPRT